MDTGFPERRLLIGNGQLHYQIFKFRQARTDGSIYITCPRFSEVRWLSLAENQGNLIVTTIKSPTEGHISVHASGITSVRSNGDPDDRKLIIPGNYLLNLPRALAGVRHLITALLPEPRKVPVNTRKSDYIMHSSKPLSPMAVMFFAVPRVTGLNQVEIECGFNIDDLESVPPETGFGLIELAQHSVAWLTYRTKYMGAWVDSPHICYYDGFHVPAFMGKRDEGYQLIIIKPDYEATTKGLKISLSFGKPGGSTANHEGK